MHSAQFDSATTVTSQDELRALFKSDRIYLRDGGAVTFENEIVLGSEVSLSGDCRLSGPLRVENGSILTNAEVGPRSIVRPYSVLENVRAGEANIFGPFCFLRDDCVVASDCILGAHVEAARSTFGSGVKISHRAFIGDATLSENVIIGAGVVFCNFDGAGRQKTWIESGVTVGSGSLIVAPVTIGEGAVIAAGSAVTKDVPAHAKIIQKRTAANS
jgi:bifunctional UDP-N-acetylglucosamine pyrophosphorylase/glucosamine-1-phosphate N-acetyltransferase